MPAKYAIHTKPIPPRVRPVGKLGIVDWREDCSSCHNCVKRACVYGLYRDEADTLHDEAGYLDYIYQCKGCLSCVQNCTKNILTRVVNPEYHRLGDSYYTPDVVLSTWFQAESGRIPVSGSGYGGPFSGPGFDSMWTDMSEIVRPTRDGIHGREYINTSVDIGRKLPRLSLVDGRLAVEPPPLAEVPLPVLFDIIPEHWRRGRAMAAILGAAAEVGTLAIVEEGEIPGDAPAANHVVPLLASGTAAASAGRFAAPLVMIDDRPEPVAVRAAIKTIHPGRIVAIRVAAGPAVADRVVELVDAGAEVVHMVFDSHGLEAADPSTADAVSLEAQTPAGRRHVRDVLRDVHGALVRHGTRDVVTLIASGGIAQAEHVAKAILCGADLVAIDIPLLLALECRLCGECRHEGLCPIALDEIDEQYGVQRIVNLMGTWHQQLIEVLGAMGIREVRRLRGEAGRAMFFEDLERETFGRLFGKRKNPGPQVK
ncbi:MAG: glutamate synthase-related protein [Thermoguttaceae bacterium]